MARGGLGPADLGQEAAGTRDGAGEQQGKEGQVEAEFQEVRMSVILAPVHIHGIADCLERIEGNADGQDDVADGEIAV